MNTDQSYDQVYILARPDGEEMAELTRQQFEAEGVKTVVSLSSETDLRREDLGGSIIMFVPSRQLIQEGLLNEIKSIRYSDVEKGVRRLVPIVYGDITDIEVKKALGGGGVAPYNPNPMLRTPEDIPSQAKRMVEHYQIATNTKKEGNVFSRETGF